MLKFFLDENVRPVLAQQLVQSRPGLQAIAIQDFENGRLRGKPDPEVLEAIAGGGWTLVTYDLRTIPSVIIEWAEQERSHGGVILLDKRTFPDRDVGGILQSLCRLYDEQSDLDWTDRVDFLRR